VLGREEVVLDEKGEDRLVVLANGSIGVGASLEERCDIVLEDEVAAVAEADLLLGSLDQQIAGLAVAHDGDVAVAWARSQRRAMVLELKALREREPVIEHDDLDRIEADVLA